MNVSRRFRTMVAVLFVMLIAACESAQVNPETGLPQVNPSQEAFASFKMKVNEGTITPRRGESNTLVFTGEETVGGIVYRCIIIRSSDDGSIAQQAGSMFKSVIASAKDDGCVRKLEQTGTPLSVPVVAPVTKDVEQVLPKKARRK